MAPGRAGAALLALWPACRAVAADGAAPAAAWAFATAALVVVVLAAIAGAMFGSLRSERRWAAAQRASQRERQCLQQLLDVWSWQTDASHRLLQMHPPAGAAAEAWGQRPSAGQPFWACFELASAADVAGLRARLESQAAFTDLPVVQPGSTARWTLRAVPRFDDEGRFAGHTGTARQVAEADATAAESSHGALPPALPGHRLPAADNADDSRESSESESFGYTLSHDLRAPIRVVDGFTRILKEDYGRLLDRVGNDHLDRVLSAAARMNQMIDALLTLARLSSLPLAQQPVNLTQLAGFVVDDLRRNAPERFADIEVQPGLQVVGDPTLLRLVLENLLGNAWKYSARVPRARISFGAELQDGRRVFVVRDNGAGFDMRSADRLFGLFQRLHSASDFAGTGVGLASVQRIVRRHGGQVWAEGEPGRGAAFYFTLRG